VTELHTEVHGSGTRRVLLVHGWLMSSHVWEALLPRLESEDLSIATVDLHGMGKSPGTPAPGVEGHARDVLAAADALGWVEFDLVGHSLGATITQMVAAMAPHRVRTLALLTPVPASGLPVDEETYAYLSGVRVSAESLREFLTPQFVSPAAVDRAVASALTVDPAVARITMDAWIHADFAERLDAVSMPTLVVGGSSDAFLPEAFLREALVDKLADARFAAIPTGHYPQVDRPDEVAQLLLSHWS
jgi:pimeloyl-ACP methyl ester carboxylesterase